MLEQSNTVYRHPSSSLPKLQIINNISITTAVRTQQTHDYHYWLLQRVQN